MKEFQKRVVVDTLCMYDIVCAFRWPNGKYQFFKARKCKFYLPTL